MSRLWLKDSCCVCGDGFKAEEVAYLVQSIKIDGYKMDNKVLTTRGNHHKLAHKKCLEVMLSGNL